MWFLSLYVSGKEGGLSVEEFRKIFLEMYPSLCVYASGYLNDKEASKDVVQEVLTTFWAENEKLKNKDLVKPYLFKAVKHKALNYKKREARKSPLDTFFEEFNAELSTRDDESVENFMALDSLMDDLEAAIDELPEQRRKIFRMSRFEQMKHKDIAEALGISPRTVETQIFRALQFLRERLKHYL
ncbi:RNA polymerase sigma-70 factor [Maribellus sediminis]|uniref:RNA polymerase sigma-70 factor n=1 Tax=Maribellus sediminis TaxID=2696285 RepID=UPI00143135ED|nr:RNA polymerase sigma-70 factor [Maribellus sediminis]